MHDSAEIAYKTFGDRMQFLGGMQVLVRGAITSLKSRQVKKISLVEALAWAIWPTLPMPKFMGGDLAPKLGGRIGALTPKNFFTVPPNITVWGAVTHSF
jgi:hypothetical protein